jgi:adenosine deaminase
MMADRRIVSIILLGVLLSAAGYAQSAHRKSVVAATSEQKASAYFESVRNQPSLLMEFLERMPKGADLHNHLSGAVYAESFIRWAVQDGLCVDRATSTFVSCETAKDKTPASAAYTDVALYEQLLDAFSMRGRLASKESGHDHFFATFGKFNAATYGHTADMIEEVRTRAAREHLQYMELMFNPDNGQAASLGKNLGWDPDLPKFREDLLAGGLTDIVTKASHGLDEMEAKEKQDLRCGQSNASPACAVQTRYLYQVARGLAKEMVFAQILAGFEMASHDPRVVGLNLVMAEDWYVPIRDFNLHMDMIDYLHQQYPKVHITLHAGELTQVIAEPEDMFHIRASVEKAHAERIGHGVDLMHEPQPLDLLKEMAAKHVLVEICLTSNDVILNVTGARHPLPMYLKYGVPVALATDDEGVSRGNMTQEYQRAAETYHLSYGDLKNMARASLTYSFLPGDDLQTLGKGTSACAATLLMNSNSPSSPCTRLLEKSSKAAAQAELEAAFQAFENQFVTPAHPKGTKH